VATQRLNDTTMLLQTGLAQNQKLVLNVREGARPLAGAVNPVVITRPEDKNYIELSNGLVGVRILRPRGVADRKLAPIQGVQLHNGTWDAEGPNQLHYFAPGSNNVNPFLLEAVKDPELTMESEGPLRTVVKLRYDFRRALWRLGNGAVAMPEGPAWFEFRLVMEAGSKSLLIEDASDIPLQYYLNFTRSVDANQARYRGHSATALVNGRENDTQVYRARHDRPPIIDALIDLPFNKPGDPEFRRNAAWDPWASNHGWYWMLFNSRGSADAPIVGTFAGPTSRIFNTESSAAGVYWTARAADGAKQVGLTSRITPFYSWNAPYVRPYSRITWGLYVDRQGAMGGQYGYPAITAEMNTRSGVNLTKFLRWQTQSATAMNIAAPAGSWLPREKLQSLMERVRNDNAYYLQLSQAEPGVKKLLDAWRDATGAKMRELGADVFRLANGYANALVNQDGIYDFHHHYWMGGLVASGSLPSIATLLADPLYPPESKAKLESIAAFYTGLLWDNDYVPMQAETGINLGTSNMPVQYVGYRSEYTLFGGNNPAWQPQRDAVAGTLRRILLQELNESGVQRAATNYISAAMMPALSLGLQLKVAGTENVFQNEPRLPGFNDFLIQLLTPPDPRFGTTRKAVPFGDSPTLALELTGILASGFSGNNEEASRKAMWAWHTAGRPHTSFAGSTVVKIDDTLPMESPALGDGHFDGYYSVLRHAFNSVDESAVWLLNGEHYTDHRHSDRGSMVMYLLGVPVAMEWGSMYSPSSGGAFAHSLVLPESTFGNVPFPQADYQMHEGLAPWRNLDGGGFLSMDYMGQSMATSSNPERTMTWQRRVRSYRFEDPFPIVLIDDRFSGPSASDPKIFALNLMARDAVRTPKGDLTPQLRTNPGGNSKIGASATQAVVLDPGINPIRFTGQWGVNFDAHVISGEAQQLSIGHWGHTWTTTNARNEFQAAQRRPFEERQHILRLRGNDSFRVLLAARRASDSAPEVTQEGADLKVLFPTGNEARIGEDYSLYRNADTLVLTMLANGDLESSGFRVMGGPSELTIRGSQISIRAHGAAGARRFRFPVPVSHEQLTRDGEDYIWNYEGGAPARIVIDTQMANMNARGAKVLMAKYVAAAKPKQVKEPREVRTGDVRQNPMPPSRSSARPKAPQRQ
jgi:hypothetical protein